MKKQYIAIVALWFTVGVSMAQNERDAFRYAQYSPVGTARYNSLAGSIGAFGADFTALSANNPAGIGLYKRMELSLSIAVPYYKISSIYNGEKQSGAKADFNCNNAGVVFAFSRPAASKWKVIQFGTGFNTLARYRGTSVVSGRNTGEKYAANDINRERGTTNFFDYVAESSYGIKDSSLQALAGVVYAYYLMDDKPDGSYSPRVVGDDFRQQQVTDKDGALYEYIFTLGGNYDDKLFVGATLGIPFSNYSQTTNYTETKESFYDTLGYDKYRYYDEFKSNAAGVNLKLGVIYQPAKFVRIGAAFHTPTWYPNVKESYQNGYEFSNLYLVDSIYRNEPQDGMDITRGSFTYQLTTPYRVMADVAFLFNQYGFINLGYELTDYTTSNLQSNVYNFNDENNAISTSYRISHTARIGGELNLSPIALRLGYSYSSNPYKKSTTIDGTRHIISAGIGFKTKTFFADFGYMYKFTNDKDVFYDAASVHPYSSELVNQVFSLTLGLKFGSGN